MPHHQCCWVDAVRGEPMLKLGPREHLMAQQQLEWLEDTLAASTADWLVVGGACVAF